MTAGAACIATVIDRRYSLAGRADWLTVAKRRQPERRTVPVRREIEEVVMRMEKLCLVVPGPGSAASAEIAVRLHARIVTARDVVRYQVDDRLQTMRVEPLDEFLEFLQTLC